MATGDATAATSSVIAKMAISSITTTIGVAHHLLMIQVTTMIAAEVKDTIMIQWLNLNIITMECQEVVLIQQAIKLTAQDQAENKVASGLIEEDLVAE